MPLLRKKSRPDDDMDAAQTGRISVSPLQRGIHHCVGYENVFFGGGRGDYSFTDFSDYSSYSSESDALDNFLGFNSISYFLYSQRISGAVKTPGCTKGSKKRRWKKKTVAFRTAFSPLE